MKRLTLTAAAALTLTLITGVVTAQDHQIKADLASAPGSHVTGFVQITQLPHGGSVLNVIARGLDPGTVYVSFYYESANCTEPADMLGTFTAMPNGTGEVHGKIDDDVDEVGSVSVRLAPGYGTLKACAKLH